MGEFFFDRLQVEKIVGKGRKMLITSILSFSYNFFKDFFPSVVKTWDYFVKELLIPPDYLSTKSSFPEQLIKSCGRLATNCEWVKCKSK